MTSKSDKEKYTKKSNGTEILLIVLIIIVLFMCGLIMFKMIKNTNPDNGKKTTEIPKDNTPVPTETAGEEVTPGPASEAPTETPYTTPTPTPTQAALELVDYTGHVEHIFTHSLIAYPELCFRGDINERLSSTYFVDCITVNEFKALLEALYRDGYMLINLNDCYETVVNNDGTKSINIVKPIKFPKGKKPLVLSFDDVNYYSKKAGNGFVDKIVLKDGKIMTYTKMKDGTEIYSDDNEHIVILDKFVEEHPDFSFNGAKGMLCVTGFEGVLGYRVYRILTEGDPNDPLGLRTEATRQAEIDAVTPIVAKLKETGWYFASHSYKHGSMSAYNENGMYDDAIKFKNEITPIIGETKIYVYPYGDFQASTEAGVVPPAQKVLNDFGFEFFCGVGVDWFVKNMNGTGSTRWYLGGILWQDRANFDGTSMLKYRDKFLQNQDGSARFPSLDVAVIWDTDGRGISYEDAYGRKYGN